jgi:AraC-like DNA-binding protein
VAQETVAPVSPRPGTAAPAVRVDRIDAWEALGSAAFVPLQCRAAAPGFHGVMTSDTVGPLPFTHLRTSAHEVARTRRTIALNDPGVFKLGLQVSGTGRIEQNGRQALLAPGDMVFYDTSRPYTMSMRGTAPETVVLMFSASELDIPVSALASLAAVPLSGAHGLPAMVSSFVGRLPATVTSLDPAVRSRLGQTARDLVETMVRQVASLRPGDPERHRASQLVLVKQWIEQRLGDPELTPAAVAAAHHMSLRQLYRLFETQGAPVAEWIRARRLARCRDDLADPALASVGVAALAARHGLYDPAGFSRAFRSAYGLSPREFRAGGSGKRGTG